MIRVNCQYNVGGFRLFKLCYNQEMEYLLSEKAEHSTDAPIESLKYVNTAGVKFVYQHLESGEYVIVLTNIDSIYCDDSGRPTKSAVIFSSDASERNTMDNIALDILNNQERFEQFFSNLFSFYNGFNVRYNGEKIAEYIQEMQKEKTYAGESQFLKILKRTTDILCLIPIYASWSKDVQEKISRELSLNPQWYKKAFVLTSEQWATEQNSLIISEKLIEKKEEKAEQATVDEDTTVTTSQLQKKPDVPVEKDNCNWRLYLGVCLSALSAYITAWKWLTNKKKDSDPVLMKAFIVSQIIILILLVILICMRLAQGEATVISPM